MSKYREIFKKPLVASCSNRKQVSFVFRKRFIVNFRISFFFFKLIGVSLKFPYSIYTKTQKEQLSLWVKNVLILIHMIGQTRVSFEKQRNRELKSIKHYKGLRLRRSLPVRGQNTRNNARTARKINKNK